MTSHGELIISKEQCENKHHTHIILLVTQQADVLPNCFSLVANENDGIRWEWIIWVKWYTLSSGFIWGLLGFLKSSIQFIRNLSEDSEKMRPIAHKVRQLKYSILGYNFSFAMY